jgi:opacity protein-like surface antigen
MKLTGLAAAVALVLSTAAFANDGIGGLDTGNIKLGHTDKVAMAKEVLDISPDKIDVDYEFLNESPADVHESLVFPLPTYGADDDTHDGYWGQPRGFHILVDGEPRQFSTSVVARFNGRDITAQLKALGLTDKQIALFPGPGDPFKQSAKAYTPEQFAAIRKNGWVTSSSQGVDDIPAWTVSVAYVWYLTFPAGKVVHVHHEYRPFPTIGIGTVQLTASDLRTQACADNAFLADWKKVSKPDGDSRYTEGLFVGYVLKTGNTWKDGIRDFTLRLHRTKPEGLISACFDGQATSPDPLTREYHLTNFHPQRDLSVYFGNIPEVKEPENKRVAPVISGE